MENGAFALPATKIHLYLDFSWVPESLRMLVAGMLGCAQYISVLALISCMTIFMWTKLTRTLIDNPRGVGALVAVCIGSIVIGSLATLVGWGCGLFKEPFWVPF